MSNLKIIELENPDFESHFKVRSDNAIEARYLLTPLFMEALLRLREKYGDDVQVAFFKSRIILSIPHPENFLEIGFRLDNLTAAVEKMSQELLRILETIEELDLDNRIWNKGSERAGA